VNNGWSTTTLISHVLSLSVTDMVLIKQIPYERLCPVIRVAQQLYVRPSCPACSPAAQRPSSRLSDCSRCLPTSPTRAAPAFTPCVGLPVCNRPPPCVLFSPDAGSPSTTDASSLCLPSSLCLHRPSPNIVATAAPLAPAGSRSGGRSPGASTQAAWDRDAPPMGIERRTAPHRRSPRPSTGDPSAPLLTMEVRDLWPAGVLQTDEAQQCQPFVVDL
jgi:hypothetical protein